MDPTKLLYLEDFTGLECSAIIQSCSAEDNRTIITLDQTIFYPQGGGQPYDQGIITSSSAEFLVEEVRFVEGIVKHIGKFRTGQFTKDEQVRCVVDKNRRELNSRLHSAGHLVDMAVNKLNLDWTPGKGFHFPDGSYVEYTGSIENQDKDQLITSIEKICNDFIQAGMETKVVFMEKEEMQSVCHFVPEFIPEGKPGRVVMFGDFGVPCGGTHVANLTEIKNMSIRKIKSEGQNLRVSYAIQ